MSAVTRRLGDGATETPVHDAGGRLIAVITRPGRGADFFLHRAGAGSHRERFKTLQAALAAVSS